MEKTIEAYLRQQVKESGGLALKLVCPGWSGVPDRLILLPGARVFFAETKDTGKSPVPGRSMSITGCRTWASRYLSQTARKPLTG